MKFRTDLALELQEDLDGLPEGIACGQEMLGEIKITRMQIHSEAAAQRLGKPCGRYITVELPPFGEAAQLLGKRLDTLVGELRTLLPPQGDILVVGLGNDGITPDALGPKCADMLLATRHIRQEMAADMGLGALRVVSGIAPGVLGRTGIETGEIIAGIVRSISPAAVITVDALAARRLSRMGCTVQLADSGIVPGSGVGNARLAVNRETLGVPVISIGVPTVVDALTLTMDVLAARDFSFADSDALRAFLGEEPARMMVTPRDIDLVVERAARLIAMALNCALQPHIPPEDLLALAAE